ncbi:S9 family peptidase [Bacteroides sp. 51]|nr:prolyl oligopeptidase family serine peptidase [Bacteroides sp. 51]NDV83211.1 S9 family peptidase [Bacteroides sp. 51]
MKKITLTILCACLSPLSIFAQRALTVDDLVQWNRITDRVISPNGKWIAATMAPWEGDAAVYLYNAKGEETATYFPAQKSAFSFSSRYLLVTKTPLKETLDSLKVAKVKKDKLPLNSLIIRSLSGGEEVLDSIKSYQLAEQADWIAYKRGQKDSTLIVRSLDGKYEQRYPAVSSFKFARKSGALYCVSNGDSLNTKPGIYLFQPEKQVSTLIKEGKGVFKQAALSEQGDALAFLYCAEKDSTWHALDLWLSENAEPANKIADRKHAAIPKNWVISENRTLRFSEDAKRLYFGTAPEPRQKDTTQLAEYRPNVQVWSWDEPVQYTVQTFEHAKDMKKSYQAVYNIKEKTLFQLSTEELPDIALPDKGELALISTARPYSLSSMWEGHTRRDVYSISLVDGKKELLLQGRYANPRISPEGKYAYWYERTDSCWYTIDLAIGKEYRLTNPETFTAWDEENDVPDYPDAYGIAGWTHGDESILIYDRYDIWRFDPDGAKLPALLTAGRGPQIQYRLIRLDKEEKSIDIRKKQLLSGFQESTRRSGYYSKSLASIWLPQLLISGDYMLREPIKAKESDAILYTIETFERYPDLYLSNLSFRKSLQLTHGHKQQEGIKWGTAELLSWTSLDGKPLEGVVYKPADFDPAKKYPLIVNFYERNSETLHNYRMPDPHRSTVDYHLYNSNDYIIFNPDVVYEDGHPGESCYNCVMPGISSLISQGYINQKAIAAQGHSWGGYQVAYLATRTDLFAAIESGAPVVNMFSAYGGIRWGSGLARSFQYEHGQSRIGGTPWTAGELFIENSPLFTMDKVQTPILIMHNDADGHVPWYQGIEYFVALKRLQKPVWMLNYTGEIHWPMRMANRIDFQKRMFQFFNHYLKNEPMPRWMKDGLPAVDKDFDLGY